MTFRTTLIHSENNMWYMYGMSIRRLVLFGVMMVAAYRACYLSFSLLVVL